jgi:Family of unknown function (DUF5715)
MNPGRTILSLLAALVILGLGGPLAYRYYLLHVAPRQAAPRASTQPAPAPTATPVVLAAAPAPAPGTLEAAVAQVEEVRGSAGRVEVPDELRHYEDHRRFLAVQMADSQERQYRLPDDEADLSDMIQRGEVVEMSPLSDDYVLYDLGTDATDDPLVHYDPESGKDVRLFPSLAEYEAEDERLAKAAAGSGKAAAKARAERELLASHYGDPERRKALFREHQAVTTLASNFGGAAYDLHDLADRRRFQVRLLSFIRPRARDVLLEIAKDYHERFGRPLPVTSMIRTQRYQRRLGRVNRNATPVELPPHSTGMAFDLSYKFMPPDEQNFIMEEVARLKEGGRVEALRERRNHFHVYVLADGPPSEALIASFFDEVEAAHPNSAPRPAAAPASSVRRPSSRALRGSRGR